VEDFRWDWIVPLMRSLTALNIIARAADRMESLRWDHLPRPDERVPCVDYGEAF